MFLITADFRASRSSGKNKSGVVFYKIVGSHGDLDKKSERKINSPIRGYGKEILREERVAIRAGLKLLYCVIEKFENRGEPYTIDDVSMNFRKALMGDSLMQDVIAKSKTDFAMTPDLVSVGSAFKGEFRYNYLSGRKNDSDNLIDYIYNQSLIFKNQNRMSKAQAYMSTLNSLREYAGTEVIPMNQISKKWIANYERFLKCKGLKDGTVSFYLRNLRTILKNADVDGYLHFTGNWFQDVDTAIYRLSEEGRIVIPPEKIDEIRKLDLSENPSLDLVRDMFIFGFYCRGLELVDIANLTWGNIQGDKLVYKKRLKGSLRRVPIDRVALEVINKYKDNSRTYLFPFMDNSNGCLFSSIRNSVNIKIKAIGKLVGFPSLTFSSNIYAWEGILSQSRIADLIFSSNQP